MKLLREARLKTEQYIEDNDIEYVNHDLNLIIDMLERRDNKLAYDNTENKKALEKDLGLLRISINELERIHTLIEKYTKTL